MSFLGKFFPGSLLRPRSAPMSSLAPASRAVRVALVQLGNVTADKSYNLQHARDMVLKAVSGSAAGKPDLIVLPECFNSPYGVSYFPTYAENIGYTPGEPYDVEKSESESIKMLSSVAKEAGTWLIGGSVPEHDVATKKYYNTATVYSPNGELVAYHRKLHLFDIDIPGKIRFKESEILTGGNALTHFDTEFGRFGLGICYDIRFPEMAMIAARKGCIAMIYPGAFNMTTGPLHWELLARARATDNQIYVAVCSPARDLTATYHAWGHSSLVDPMGLVISTTEEREDIIYGEIDPKQVEETRSAIPVAVQRRFDVYKNVAE